MHAVIERQKVAGRPAAMRRVNQANVRDRAVRGPGVLALGPFNKPAVALVLHTVVHE